MELLKDETRLREAMLFLDFENGFKALKVPRDKAFNFEPQKWQSYSEKFSHLASDEFYQGYIIIKRTRDAYTSTRVCYLDGALTKVHSLKELYTSIYQRFPKFAKWKRREFREVYADFWAEAYYLKHFQRLWPRDLSDEIVRWGNIFIPQSSEQTKGELWYIETFFDNDIEAWVEDLCLGYFKEEAPKIKTTAKSLVARMREGLKNDSFTELTEKEKRLLLQYFGEEKLRKSFSEIC